MYIYYLFKEKLKHSFNDNLIDEYMNQCKLDQYGKAGSAE